VDAVVASVSVRMSHRFDPEEHALRQHQQQQQEEDRAPSGVKLHFGGTEQQQGRAKSPVTVRAPSRDTQHRGIVAARALDNTYSAPRPISTLDRLGATTSRGVLLSVAEEKDGRSSGSGFAVILCSWNTKGPFIKPCSGQTNIWKTQPKTPRVLSVCLSVCLPAGSNRS